MSKISCSATCNKQKVMTGKAMHKPISVFKLTGFLAHVAVTYGSSDL